MSAIQPSEQLCLQHWKECECKDYLILVSRVGVVLSKLASGPVTGSALFDPGGCVFSHTGGGFSRLSACKRYEFDPWKQDSQVQIVHFESTQSSPLHIDSYMPDADSFRFRNN